MAGDQVALGSIYGAEGLRNPRRGDVPAGGGQSLAQADGEGPDLLQRGDALLKHGLLELAGAVGGLPELLHQVGKLLTGKTE